MALSTAGGRRRREPAETFLRGPEGVAPTFPKPRQEVSFHCEAAEDAKIVANRMLSADFTSPARLRVNYNNTKASEATQREATSPGLPGSCFAAAWIGVLCRETSVRKAENVQGLRGVFFLSKQAH